VSTAKDVKKKRPGRRATGKITITVRVRPETKKRLEKAATQLNLDSSSEYVEEAILAKLQKDGIK
jgi:predicted transcriptional regulator